MQDWFWVRHGPTHARSMIGWTDLPADLSDTARIARVGDFLPGDAPIVSSDLRRAVQTAAAIAPDKTPEAQSDALREIHFGTWEQRCHAEVEAEDRDRIFAFWDKPGSVSAPGGESWDDLRARVDTFVDAWRDPGPIIAVAHMGVILSQLQRALAIPARDTFAYKIDNLSVTHLRRRADGRWGVKRINHHP